MADCRTAFITGTDTGCGKTRVTTGIMLALQQRGLSVAGMKPVASGCVEAQGRLVNDDALRLQRSASARLDYDLVNPVALRDPVAPHLAARREGRRIEPAMLRRAFERLRAQSRVLLVEGIGGWRVPLGGDYEQADLVRDWDLPVILVVGLRLGCINHARLTAEAIRADGLSLQGWVANRLDNHYDGVDETLACLGAMLKAPLLGQYPFQQQEHDNVGADELELGFLL